MRLSRKNDPPAVRSRQQELGLPEVDLEPYAKAAEAVTGLVSIPVSVAQLNVSLGEYELSEKGEVVETGEGGVRVKPFADFSRLEFVRVVDYGVTGLAGPAAGAPAAALGQKGR